MAIENQVHTEPVVQPHVLGHISKGIWERKLRLAAGFVFYGRSYKVFCKMVNNSLNMETHNIAKIALTATISSFVVSLIIYKTGGFEIAVIFLISLVIGYISACCVGIENTIIITKNKDKKNNDGNDLRE